jgi:hypothetical protein
MSNDKKVKIKLEGLDGNAFALMGAFSNAAKRQGFSQDWIDEVLEDATSRDYNHLLSVLMEHTEE